jgi:hypothetical protein
MMSFNQQAQLPAGTRTGRGVGHRPVLEAPPSRGCESPRVIRMPAGWWDVPPAVGCWLNDGPSSASVARHVTRNTLLAWGLPALAADAETIVGELAANAVTHGAALEHGDLSAEPPGLRLLRRAGEVICAVLDASGAVPVLRPPGATDEAGRGLRIVDALSDVWGWSPVSGRGKAIWAILFCPEPLGDGPQVPSARRQLTCIHEHDANATVSGFLPGGSAGGSPAPDIQPIAGHWRLCRVSRSVISSCFPRLPEPDPAAPGPRSHAHPRRRPRRSRNSSAPLRDGPGSVPRPAGELA